MGWGIAAAVAVHHVYMIFYAADAWRAPPPWSGVRAPGRQEEKKGTKNPGSALLAIVTLDTWPTTVGQPCADPTAIAACLGCVWLTWERACERASLSSSFNGERARTDQRVRCSGRGHYC